MTRVVQFVGAVALCAFASSCSSSRSAAAPPASGPPAVASSSSQAPQALRFIEGRWQSVDPRNEWQMTATWNGQAGRFDGVLSRNGEASAGVGFTVGEVVWKATPQGEGSVREEQMFRGGGGAHWREGSVNLRESTPERLVTSQNTFVRVP